MKLNAKRETQKIKEITDQFDSYSGRDAILLMIIILGSFSFTAMFVIITAIV